MNCGVLTDCIRQAADHILVVRSSVPASRAALVAISGIDGSGKGHLTRLLEAELTARGCRVANINIDGWLQLPERRFDPARPAEHFFERGIRFDEMLDQLVLPLRSRRSLRLTAQHADSTNRPSYEAFDYAFDDIDVILLEGIFLLRRELRLHFDLSIWIRCTMATALERALARNQEGLPRDAIVRDYQTIYFAAQRLHIERDDPQSAAHLVITNDPRLAPGVTADDMAATL